MFCISGYGLSFWRQVIHQPKILQCFQTGNDERSIQIRAFRAGVGVILRENRFDFIIAHFFIAIGNDVADIDVRNVFRLGNLSGPFAILPHSAFYFAVSPNVAHGAGQQDGMGALGFGVGNKLLDVPAERMNQVGVTVRHFEFSGLVSNAGQVAARTACIWWAAVIMAELNEHIVPRFHVGENAVPKAFFQESSGAAAGAGTVSNVDFAQIEVAGKWVAPTAVVHIFGSGIAGINTVGRLALMGDPGGRFQMYPAFAPKLFQR